MGKKMRVKVDLDLCQGHSVCMEEAPEVFRVDEQESGYAKTHVLLENPPEALREKVEAAARWCPNGVITIEMVDEDD